MVYRIRFICAIEVESRKYLVFARQVIVDARQVDIFRQGRRSTESESTGIDAISLGHVVSRGIAAGNEARKRCVRTDAKRIKSLNGLRPARSGRRKQADASGRGI